MNCPYWVNHGNGYIECKRGYARRTALFFGDVQKDRHICKYCNDAYTSCKTYKKLVTDWGEVNAK